MLLVDEMINPRNSPYLLLPTLASEIYCCINGTLNVTLDTLTLFHNTAKHSVGVLEDFFNTKERRTE